MSNSMNTIAYYDDRGSGKRPEPDDNEAAKIPSGGTGGGSGGEATYVDSNGQRQPGTVNYDNSYWNSMRDYYRKAYESQVAANNAAANSTVARANEVAEEQRRQLNAGYQNTNRQLYRDYMENQRVLPQQMAAQGYTGGLSESGRLRLSTSYGENLANNERARISEESAVNSALAQQEYEARAAAAQANSQAAQSHYAALAGLRGQQYQERRDMLEDRAARLAQAGDFSGYLALGYSMEDAEYLAQMWRQMNPELAEYQATGSSLPSQGFTKAPQGSSTGSVALYIQSRAGTARAIDYIAEELAAGNIYSDEAERIWKELRATTKR